MPLREVSKPWSESGLRLPDLHHDEAGRRIMGASIEWDGGSINPFGGLLYTSFILQARATDEQLPKLVEAIATAWLTRWESVAGSQPALLIEREGATEEGEPIAFDIVGERECQLRGRLLVKLPIQENHLLATDGFAYRRMEVGRQHSRYTRLSPVLTEAVECFGFPATRREPSQEVPIAVVCIAPMKVDHVGPVQAVLEEAVGLGCRITVSLRAWDLPRRYYAALSLKRIDGEWVLTASVVGGKEYWRIGMIALIEDFIGFLIPPKAKVSYLERYVGPPRLPRFRLPSGKLGKALGAVLVVAMAPFAATFGAIGKVYTTAEQWVASRTWQPIGRALEKRRKAEEARKSELTGLFEAVGLGPQKRHAEACFLAIDEGVEKDPVAARAMLKQGEPQPEVAADEGGEG